MIFSAIPVPGPVRPHHRAGFLRSRHGRRHPRPPVTRHRHRRPDRAGQPGTPRRRRAPSRPAGTAQASCSSYRTSCCAPSGRFALPSRRAGIPTPPASPSCPSTAGRDAAKAVELIERIADEEGLLVLGWRDVPVDPGGRRRRPDRALGDAALRHAVRGRQAGRRRPPPAASTSTGSPSACASAPSTRPSRRAAASTSPRCPRAPWSTREC